MELKKRKILGTIACTWIFATLASLAIIYIYIAFTKNTNEDVAQHLDPGAIAYGLTIFCNLGLSFCALTSLLSVRRFFRLGFWRFCSWFLLPLIFVLCILFSTSNGQPTLDHIGVFLLMMFPWFLIWVAVYKKRWTGKLPLLTILTVFASSCTSSGTRNDALALQDTTIGRVDSLLEEKPVSKGLIVKPDTVELAKEQFVTCDEPFGNMEEGFTTICFWYGYDLQEAYAAFRTKNEENDDGKFLEKILPNADMETSLGEYPLAVNYRFTSANTLIIELNFPGGSTSIHLTEKEKGVEISTIHSPD